ncbi:hypothetical protein EV644_102548 [Kribbella orskensis]|uniref:Arsenate reductase n=1 Tax=Kribbella orskensis TaxID=2512216 RepID=A0ABY2BSF5_9ACTN|nr:MULTISPECIES: hypothetical protein [Kribbella]TCN42817.1 hypothetical protein EV642_102189 [Kribbella sp. VKM Ac-2500]TCO29827.1 hypothetical protein EV644_102548 [Kribbella orskensis]
MSTSENLWVPSACTLPTVEQPLRAAEFEQLFARSVQAVRRVDPITLDLTIASTAEAEARDLARREIACCAFFTFDFLPADDDALVLRIGVPVSATYTAVLDAVQARALTAQAGGQRM